LVPESSQSVWERKCHIHAATYFHHDLKWNISKSFWWYWTSV